MEFAGYAWVAVALTLREVLASVVGLLGVADGGAGAAGIYDFGAFSRG